MCSFSLRARIFFSIFLALISSLAGHDAVHAGAFLQEQGKGQIIVTSSFDRSDRFFDASGKLQPLAQYKKFEMVTYAEYGATDWLTLIFAPSSSQSIGAIGIQQSADRYARLEAGVRARLWHNENSVVSFQAVFRAPYAINRGLLPGLRREVNEADVRALYGYSFPVWDRSGFVSAEVGYRLRTNAADELRADITIGYRAMPRLLLLLQNFNMMSKSAVLVPAMRSHKLQFSSVFDLTEKWTIQGGIYATLLGKNIRREQGVTGGLWRKF